MYFSRRWLLQFRHYLGNGRQDGFAADGDSAVFPHFAEQMTTAALCTQIAQIQAALVYTALDWPPVLYTKGPF